MQYLINVLDSDAGAANGTATGGEMAAIDAFNDRLRAQGHWVFAGGLSSPEQATVIDNRTGNPMISDGPLLESKEHVAGFWVIEAADLDEAMRLATEGSNCCKRKVEVRPFLTG